MLSSAGVRKIIDPVPIKIVMPIQFCFGVACDESVLLVFRALPDGLTMKVERDRRVFPTDFLYPQRRDKNLFARPPILYIDNQVTNDPCLVVDDKILDVPDLTVQGLDGMPSYILCAAKMRILMSVVKSRFGPPPLAPLGILGCPPLCSGRPNMQAIRKNSSIEVRTDGKLVCPHPEMDCSQSAFWSSL